MTLLTSLLAKGPDMGTLIVGMVSVFVFLLVVILVARYVLGKLKPLKLPAIPALCGCEPSEDNIPFVRPSWLERVSIALDYLHTRREWRYKKPWIMLLGERSAGKSSLLASIPAEFQQPLEGRSKQLAIPGTQWHDLNQGFFIDPQGILPYSAALAPTSSENEHQQNSKHWGRVLTQLNNLRPERALDGIVLVISADNLKNATRAQRQATAENIRLQLQGIEQSVEFALPVYVVVTALDSVPGFRAFWRNQNPSRKEQILGWSAPVQSLDSPPSTWAQEAFDQLSRQLKPLQVEAAANSISVHSDEADQAFLFPKNVEQLRESFQECLSIIFQASSWQTTFFCRGVYFTGARNASGGEPVAQDLPRNDIAFISDLLFKKILSEPGLARRTRVGVWSRNSLIRRLQVACVSAFSLMLLALVLTCFRIDTQVDTVVTTLKRIQQMQASVNSDNSCILQGHVIDLLEQVTSINANAHSWFIPISLIDNRLSRKSAQRIASEAFKFIILPGLACQIQQREIAISKETASVQNGDLNYPKALLELQNYVGQVNALEQNVARFKGLLGAPPLAKTEDKLPEFIKLMEYAYGTPLPDYIFISPGLLVASLDSLNSETYPSVMSLPNHFKADVSRYILASAKQVNEQLGAELQRGTQLLNLLEQKKAPILSHISQLITWLNWVREAWLGSSETQNPLLQIQTDLAAQLQPLIQIYGYPELALKSASQLFDAENQYEPAMNILNEIQLPAYGSLFTMQPSGLDINPKLNVEMMGLQAVSVLEYMAIDPALEFTCQGQVASWDMTYLNQALSYYQQYQSLLSNPLLEHTGSVPLYQQLAIYQLERVLNHSVQQAQEAAQASGNNLTKGRSHALGTLLEQQQARISPKFAKLLAPIQALQGIYSSQQLTASGAAFDECVSQFANNNLAQIQRITDQSQLYQLTLTAAANSPTSNSLSSSINDGNEDFFDLGSTAVLKDFLARQIGRVQALVDYATPFLNYLTLSNSTVSANTDNPDTAPYWNNTVLELQRYIQAKDPNAQANLLDTLFLKQFPNMNRSNCNATLNAYQAPEYGNDLFSNYRQHLEQVVASLCNGQRNVQALTLYQQWASRFNKEIAGRYPFAALNSKDAKLSTVKAFFTDYEASRVELAQSLAGFTGSSWAARRQFLTELDSVAAFFHNSLLQVSDAKAIVNLQTHFRALEGEGSEQVASWYLSTPSNSIAYPNQGTSLDWLFGQSLSLKLSWAGSSPWRPAFAAAPQTLIVEGITATFTESGNWALLRFIANHQPHSGEQLDTTSDSTLLLEFNVPLIGAVQPGAASADIGNATLYLSMQLSSLDSTTMASAGITLPALFPTAAPQ